MQRQQMARKVSSRHVRKIVAALGTVGLVFSFEARASLQEEGNGLLLSKHVGEDDGGSLGVSGREVLGGFRDA